jgi:hypothetical protein
VKLEQIQQTFCRAIIDGHQSLFMQSIQPISRLSIYHHNMMSNLSRALMTTYAVTRQLVGDDFFAAMAKQYVMTHHSNEFNLSFYGADFSAFIANYAPAATVPYLTDVARFEWLWFQSYSAHNDQPLSKDDLQRLATEHPSHQYLRCRASVYLVTSPYPVDLIWQFCQTQGLDPAPDLTCEQRFLMLLRPEFEVVYVLLSSSEYLLLQSLQHGMTLHHAVTETLSADAQFNLAAFLERHLALTTFCQA